jgi:hypothetical protein
MAGAGNQQSQAARGISEAVEPLFTSAAPSGVLTAENGFGLSALCCAKYSADLSMFRTVL